MKNPVFWLIFLLFTPRMLPAQEDLYQIDQRVRNIKAPTADSLASMLTSGLQAEKEKVRAIYSWIAQNIRYNTGIFSYSKSRKSHPILFDDEDSLVNWGSANEMTAARVMKKGVAICDGYSKLFKTLCDYAGLKSEIVLGYASSGYENESRFRTNHSWNAVMIDGKWELIDVTWGSGYVNFANMFVQQLDERYFLPDPEIFYRDHYPEDPFWSLLDDPRMPAEYGRSPFRLRNFIKYNISHHLPAKGLIVAGQQDTVRLEIQLKDIKNAQSVSPDPFFDSSFFTKTRHSVFLQPRQIKGNKLLYSFVPGNEDVRWVYLMFNEDLVLRYRIRISRDILWGIHQ